MSLALRVALAALAACSLAVAAIGLRVVHLDREGLALSRQGGADLSKALADFRDEEQLDVGTDARRNAASVLYLLGRYREGIAELQPALSDEPDNADLWRLLDLLARRVDPALARHARARALALAPRVPPPS